MKKYLLLIIVLISLRSFGQKEMSLYFLENAYQSSYVNPTAMPVHSVSMGFPGSSLYASFINTAFKYNDFENKSGSIDPYYALDHANFRKSNLISSSVHADMFHLRVKVNKFLISYNLSYKQEFGLTFPTSFIETILKGNVDDKIEMGGLGINFDSYMEHAIGAMYFTDKWRIGGKLKYLKGLVGVKTANSQLDFYTDGSQNGVYDYQIDADMSFATANLPKIDFDTTDSDEEEFTSDDIKSIFTKGNRGFAIDLGAYYRLNEKFDFSVSVVDLGFIKWNTNVNEYSFKYTFNTNEYNQLSSKRITSFFDENDTTTNDGDFFNADSVSQDLEDSYVVKENGSYVSALPTKIYLQARYKILDHTYANALLNFSTYKGFRTAFTLGVQHDFKRWFSLSLTNTVQYKKLFNVGFAAILKPGPFQFYMAMDNITDLMFWEQWVDLDSQPYIPTRLNQVSVRFGVNVVFGSIRKQDVLQTQVD